MTLRLLIVLAVLLATLALVSTAIRLRPVPQIALARPETRLPPGDHRDAGGIVAVRRPEDPPAAFADLARIVGDAPRTRIVTGGPDAHTLTAVTRTRVLGFPDVSHLWVDGGRLYLSGRLVMGAYDFGVNARRIHAWLDEAGLRDDGVDRATGLED